MTPEEFAERFRAEEPVYKAWGQHVYDKIKSAIMPAFNCEHLSEVLKVDAPPRVKDLQSALSKAFNRKKYDDPWGAMTDKVGCRFVVMLEGQIEGLKKIIQVCDDWTYSKDKDYEEIRNSDPTVFAYQSVHYVVRAKAQIAVGGLIVPPGIPCEVQLRTLLQHAYSELTHDTIYKGSRKLPPDVHRVVARSMALIEAADQCFVEANEKIERLMVDEKALQADLERAYRAATGIEAASDRKLFGSVCDALGELAKVPGATVREFLQRKSYVAQKIKARVERDPLFRQPLVLLLYYLADHSPDELREKWPFTLKRLENVFSDLGVSMA